jgi:hypothetical protein
MRLTTPLVRLRPFLLSAAFASALFLGASPSALHAQHDDRVRPTEQECRKAARDLEHDLQKLAKGQKPNTERGNDYRLSPADVLRLCDGPAAGEAAVSALSLLRTETRPDTLLQLLEPFWGLRDSAYFRALSDLVRDRGASTPARVIAVRSLLGQLLGGNMTSSYQELTVEGIDCGGAFITGLHAQDGTPMPTDALEQTRRLLDAVQRAPGEPAALRNAAACVLKQLG